MHSSSFLSTWSTGGKKSGETIWRKLARGCRRFLKDEPGRRFVDCHQRWRKSSKNPALNATLLVTGVLLVAGGLVLGFVPGVSGFALGVPGTMLIASRSHRAAVWLDWMEVKGRCAWGMTRCRSHRRQHPRRSTF